MNAVQPHRARELFGPDLELVPPLDAQLARLDVARDSDADDALHHYMTEWLAVSDEIGEGTAINWGNDDAADAEGDVFRWVACDDQEEERRRRWNALTLHYAEVSGFRAELCRELRRRGRFIDNRKTTVREICGIVRAFVATGGRLLIDPSPIGGRADRYGAVEPMPDANRFVREDWSEVDQVATQAMFRIAQRWRAQPIIERIVRAIGARTDNGWIVLQDRFDPGDWIDRVNAADAPETQRLIGMLDYSAPRIAMVRAAMDERGADQ